MIILILCYGDMNMFFSIAGCYLLRDEILQQSYKSLTKRERWERLCVCKTCGRTWEAGF